MDAASAQRGVTSGAPNAERSRGECLRLIADEVVGRVVVTDAELPDVHQVNYLLDDQDVIFRTPKGSKLAAAALHAVVGSRSITMTRRPGRDGR